MNNFQLSNKVYVHLLRALRMADIKESITLIQDRTSTDPIIQMEQAATLRTLTTQLEE